MKKYLLLLLLISFTLSGCKVGTTTESRGYENESYLQFVQGTQIYDEGVLVFVDDLQPFTAKVNKVKAMTVKGDVYTVKSGKRHLKVVSANRILFEKDILLSSQETRRIQLP